MMLSIDLLGIPRAEYCEHNGVKGVFIPETPNFRYLPARDYKRGSTPARAMLSAALYKTTSSGQKYDYFGRMRIFPEYQDIYLASPLAENRLRYMIYGYNWIGKHEGDEARVSDASDFEKLLAE